MLLRTGVWVVLPLLVLACAETEPAVEREAGEVAVQEEAAAAPASADELMTRFVEVWNRDDQAGLGEMLASDAVLVGEGEPMRGRDAVLSQWAAENMPATRNLQVQPVASGVGDRFAYQSGRWTLEVTPENQPAQNVGGTHTFVWARQPDGTWDIASMHVVNDPPAQAQGS